MPIPMTLYNQTVVLQPMKELDAVNTMLLVAGESPVDTLDGVVLNVDAIQARQALSATSRDVQVEGWHFNTEYNVRLLPSPPLPGEVVVPENALRVDVSPYGDSTSSYIENIDVVQRGFRLYDLTNHTYKFSAPLHATVVTFLSFEELPDAARNYITIKAARRFLVSVSGGDAGMAAFSQQDESRARASLVREDVTGSDRGFLSPSRRNTLVGLDVGRLLRRHI